MEKIQIILKIGRNRIRKFYLGDIWFIRADGAYINIFCDKDKFTISGKTLTEIEEELKGTEFIRINRSCIVNIKKCVEFKDCACPEIKLINNEVLKPITMNLIKLKEAFKI